jgi:ABC-type multidrug transport system, ATPase and permease components
MPDDGYAPIADARSSMQRRPGRPRKIEKARDPRLALRRLVRYLAPYKASLALVGALIVLYSLLGLAGPYLMGRAIDVFIAKRDLAGLARTALLMLAVYVASNLFNLASSWVMARVSQEALREMRRELFSHLQVMPMAFFDTRSAGGLMSSLTNDIDAVNQAISQNVTSLVASSISMVGILVAMFLLNPLLSLASLIVVPIMIAFARFVGTYTRKGFRSLQAGLGDLGAIEEEAISGQRVIKAFGRKDSVLAAFREKNEAVFKAGVYANSYAMLLMPLTSVLGSFFVVVIAGLGAALALAGLTSVGTIATFINYGQNFVSPLRQLANLYNAIQAALAGAERVFDIMDAPGESADEPGARMIQPVRGEVGLEGLRFSYLPGVPVITDFDLEVRSGQTIALVGPTGAGKTTIINLLTRFYEINGGRISIDGVDIRELPRASLRRSLGLVLQDTFLFADTVMENIRYGRLEASDEECMEAARLAEADHFIRQLPRGYQTSLSERAGNLSQGQRQLLSISRAILAQPAILVLDEATSSVDTRTELRIQKALLRLMEGRTSFVIAHRLSTIRDADLVVVIDGGRIAEKGSHDELLERKGLYYELFMSQFKGNAI